MRTGLVTFHAAHHYGAMLQAYALAKAASDIAGHCEIIDYVRPHTLGTNRVLQLGFSPAALMKNAHSALHYGAFKRRYDRFEAFFREVLTVSSKRYLTNGDLTANPPVYDRYLCGSDQIWNPFIFDDQRFDPAFLLAFTQNIHKTAYAPSFGSAKLTNAHKDELREILRSFSHLSARETKGAAALQEITGRDVPVVLDPTLLLSQNDWSALAANSDDPPYLLCYFVSPPGELAGLIPELKDSLGVGAVQLAGARRKVPGVDRIVFDAGPREFLSLFQNAACIVTNSFHGAAFSIQFQKPFYCSAGGGEDGLASRTGSLLQTLGLTRRMVTGTPDQPEIDYGPVTERLQTERERSLAFLRAALS